MSMVCNPIATPLQVTMPNGCAAFQEYKSSQFSCGAGTSSASCNINISGGVPPYNTSFSYPQTPAQVHWSTLNMGAFPGGGGNNPQFGFGFSAPDMCSILITGILQVQYTVSDSRGQVVQGYGQYDVRIDREVTGGGCDCTSYGPRCYEFMGGCICPGEEYTRPCNF